MTTPTSSKIATEITSLFVNINQNKSNYWGVAYGEQACPLTCLKCNKVMVDFEWFAGNGPRKFSVNPWFCEDDTEIFDTHFLALEAATKKEGIDFHLLFEKAVEPVRKIEEQLVKHLTSKEKSKEWVFFGEPIHESERFEIPQIPSSEWGCVIL